MTAYLVGGRYVPEGVNRGNEAFVEATVGTALAGADTFQIATPDGLDPTLVPFAFVVVKKTVNPYTYAQQADIAFTSFTPGSTGVPGQIFMTASGVVDAGSTIIIRLIGA